MFGLEPEDYVSTGLDRLTDSLQKENTRALLEIFLKGFKPIEDAYLELANQKSIDIAEGVWLDYIGKIVGVSRKGLNDVDYREELRFKISVNTSDGTPNIIMNLVAQFTESADVRLINDSGTAYGVLYLNGKSNLSSELYDLVEKIKPVATRFHIQSDVNDNCFLPAYESTTAQSEVFQVSDDGVIFENFEITTDGVNFQPFFVTTESQTYYPPSLVEGRNTLYYETASQFQVTTDGITYEDFETITPYLQNKKFGVVVPYDPEYIPDNITPLTWEIEENSKQI